MVVLNKITQGKKETLCEYIDRFTKVDVALGGGSDESLKCWLFERCLRLDCALWKKLRGKEACNLKDLLSIVQPYINYKEKPLEIIPLLHFFYCHLSYSPLDLI